MTRHASERMAQRGITDTLLGDLLETGQTRYKDDTRLWIAKAIEGRHDNLVCAAVVLEDRLVVKTVMHHFQWEL
ncbi:DUF4258 domain-containing protein [Halorhodospira abdelmalekii]|uniref:DUF4258 domain-containing protein n=1 Tax=Halorhodospira abdelmalekii TaxID=421629 RepID=UPI0030840383